jgi:hypothetical protein
MGDVEILKWKAELERKRRAEEEKKKDIRVVVADEGTELEKVHMAAANPDEFEEFLREQDKLFPKSLFRTVEDWEYFCMLPIPNPNKFSLLAAMRAEKDCPQLVSENRLENDAPAKKQC